VCLSYMIERKVDTLPPDEWMEFILKRDFSSMDPEDDDTPDILAKKASDKAEALAFLDFYVDKMIPACANTKMWHSRARHFECMSQSKLSNNELRVSYGTEALCATLYKNGRNKWIAMHKWKKVNPGKKEPPRWRKKLPEENKEFQSLFSDPFSGQCKFGGWTKEGRKTFGQFARMSKTARTQNLEECVKVETDCVARLFAQYKEHYDKINDNKKKRKATDIDEDEEEDEDMDWCF
jgi:hypothetical protein